MTPDVPPRPDRSLTLPSAPAGRFPAPPGTERPRATWRWWEVVGVVLAGFLLGTLAAVPVYLIFGDTTDGGASGVSELAQGLAVDAVLMTLLVVWLNRRHPRWRAIVGFPARGRVLREAGIGALLGLLVRFTAGIAAVAVLALLKGITGNDVGLPTQVTSDLSTVGLIVFACYAAVVAPVTEEFVFRGLLFRTLCDHYGKWLGAVLSAIPFGLIHFVPDQPWQSVVALQVTMIVTGIGLALVYQRRGNLLANVAGHAAFNVIAVSVIAFEVLG